MTSREEIERLLNQTGRTLEGLPDIYPDEQRQAIWEEIASADEEPENRVLHQSDVIELLVGALRDALDKPMQKPLKFEQIEYGVACIEFANKEEIECALFCPDNHAYAGMIMYHELGSASRNYVKIDGYGKYWRAWASRPTDEERSAAAWEN